MAVAKPGLTNELSAYAVATRYGDLPDAVLREAERSLLNILGCMRVLRC